jgi:hypothetical protein
MERMGARYLPFQADLNSARDERMFVLAALRRLAVCIEEWAPGF